MVEANHPGRQARNRDIGSPRFPSRTAFTNRGILGNPGYNGGLMNPQTGAKDLPDIADIAGPELLPDFWESMGLFAVGLLVLAAVVGLAIFLYVRHTRKKQSLESPLQIVRRRLDELERDAADLPPNEFSVGVSDALKDYLSKRYGDPVRFETGEEFLYRLNQAQANALPMSVREEVGNFLSVSEEIKYGRPPDAEARKLPLLAQAREIIQAEAAARSAPNPSARKAPAR